MPPPKPPSFYVTWPPGFAFKQRQKPLNVVVVAEAFPAHREGAFLFLVDRFTRQLLGTRPFHHPHNQDLLTVSAVFVESTASMAHITDSHRCDWRPRDGSGAYLPKHDEDKAFDTPFHAAFCRGRDHLGNPEPRDLYGDDSRVAAVIAHVPELAQLPTDDIYALVIVDNDRAYGGMGRGFGGGSIKVGWVSLSGDWIDTAIHEIGHSVFGLADEYDDDGASSHILIEPDAPNVTLAASRDALLDRANTAGKPSLRIWHGLIDAATPLPTTPPNPGCRPIAAQKPLKNLPPGGVGLFEGAEHSACDAYRPRLDCKMRHHAVDFCPICEGAIDATFGRLPKLHPLSSGTLTTFWTHVLSYHEPQPMPSGIQLSRYIFSNPTGAYAIHIAINVAGEAPGHALSAPGSLIDPGWTELLSCKIGGLPHVLTFSLPLARFAIHRIADVAGMPLLVKTFDTGINGFPYTSCAVFVSRDIPHVIGYRRSDGAVEIGRIDDNATAPQHVYGTVDDSTRRWQTDLTHVVGLSVSGVPYVLKHDSVTGEVQIQSLDPPGFGPMTFVSTRHWTPGVTQILAYEHKGRSHIYRTAIGQYLALDWVWPGAIGVEMLLRNDGIDLTLDAAYADLQSSGQDPDFEHLITIHPIVGPGTGAALWSYRA